MILKREVKSENYNIFFCKQMLINLFFKDTKWHTEAALKLTFIIQ